MNKSLIKDSDSKVLMDWINVLLVKLYAISGTQMSKDDHLINAQAFICALNSKFKYLTIQEIDKACTDGANGFYGQYYGINSKTLCEWLIKYKQDKKEPSQQVNLLPENGTLTDRDKEKIMYDGCVEGFENYKKGKSIDNLAANWYNYLKNKGILKLTDEQVAEIMAQAKQVVLAELNARKFKENSMGRINDVNQIADLIAAIVKNSQNQKAQDAVIIECKRIAVKKFFDKIIELDGELTDYLITDEQI